MVSKAKIRSMQRGAHRRDRTAPDGTTGYELKPPRMVGKEYLHFGSTTDETTAFIDGLKPRIRALSANGYRKPKDIARMLNEQNVRTNLSERWSPRLAWFLLGLIYGERKDKPTDTRRRQNATPTATKEPLKSEKPVKVRK